ncbi:YqzE family protein [Heyndrickxia ginsengihumi]|uniref:YqzE family protein n=1 Tax=Heyndrickxia ginsengihumi TaxID=363870 RepID=A0A0A6VE88_9BACI|nr:YqzE family protein [Heyndrickxia ginsengihumi]KHD84849.1 hypothetical protein NG54_12995 [Heyndrickxia ginsengihumi]
MNINTNDYVKYMTETFMQHMQIPKNERKEKKLQKKNEKPSFFIRWFGTTPYYLFMFMKRK